MKTRTYWILALVLLACLAVGALLSCNPGKNTTNISIVLSKGNESALDDDASGPGDGEAMEASIDRLGKALKLNGDGTVSLDKTNANYASLSEGDIDWGRVLLGALNALVQDGLVKVNSDFSTNWLGTPPSAVESANCDKHWWGEQCSLDASTSKSVLIGLEAGDGGLIICDFVPVVDTVCEIIEALAVLPFEEELSPCVNAGEGSEFHVTWVGVAWFKCS